MVSMSSPYVLPCCIWDRFSAMVIVAAEAAAVYVKNLYYTHLLNNKAFTCLSDIASIPVHIIKRQKNNKERCSLSFIQMENYSL